MPAQQAEPDAAHSTQGQGEQDDGAQRGPCEDQNGHRDAVLDRHLDQ
jgi:hypothetical protein